MDQPRAERVELTDIVAASQTETTEKDDTLQETIPTRSCTRRAPPTPPRDTRTATVTVRPEIHAAEVHFHDTTTVPVEL